MSATNASGKLLLIPPAASAAFLVLTVSLMQSLAQPQQSPCSSASQCLSVGMFYFNNDDISDKAAQQFRAVITRYPDTTEAEMAQYYLAGYYQRKYYILRQRNRQKNSALLRQAQNEYLGYIKMYSARGKGNWLSDAHFNAALACAEMGDTAGAKGLLTDMMRAAVRDPKTYIYQVVWSPDPSDVVDASVDARALADYTRGLLGLSTDKLIFSIKQWCQTQRSRQQLRR